MKRICVLSWICVSLLFLFHTAQAAPEDWVVPWAQEVSIRATSYDPHKTWDMDSGEKFALDFQQPESNSPDLPILIFAPCAGEVYLNGTQRMFEAGWKPGNSGAYGNYVMYVPDDMPEAQVILAHFESLSEPLAYQFSQGNYRIEQGQFIGVMGKSGTGRGEIVHLHLEITVLKDAVQNLFGYGIEELKSAKTPGEIDIGAIPQFGPGEDPLKDYDLSDTPTKSESGTPVLSPKENEDITISGEIQYGTVEALSPIALDGPPLPFDGWIEYPEDTAPLSGVVTISGWAVYGQPNRVHIYVDERYLGTADRKARDDVLEATKNTGRDYSVSTPWPGYSIPWDTTGDADGSHVLRMVIEGADGEQVVQRDRTVTVQNQASEAE